jgi:hypothetical protein
MPEGELDTLPAEMAPVFVKVNRYLGNTVNVAVTLLAAVMDTEQAPPPEHAPSHLEN